MINKEFLKEQLAQMGLKSTDKVMLHSSMKAIGEVEGGADTVVDAFMEYFSEGLFMTPTHTWKQMSETYNVFDPGTEDSCVGIITNVFRKRPGVYRSLHPTHSIAAYGPDARAYVKGEELLHTPCDPRGCFGRLYDIKAKILLVGVAHARNTYIHSIEESFNIRERLTEKPTEFVVKTPDGMKKVSMYRHFNAKEPHISERFDMLKDDYFESGAAQRVKFGNAESILCDAVKLFHVTGEVLSKKPDYFIEYEK